MKFAPSALQWNKFSIIGHSMGEYSITSQIVLVPDPSLNLMDLLFLCYSGGHVAGMVVPVWQYFSCYFVGCIYMAVILFVLFYFPQFSALYPEMVNALIFLDCFGFLPADLVHKHINIFFKVFCSKFSYNTVFFKGI